MSLKINELEVFLYGEKVGTLFDDKGTIYFQYSTAFKSLGYEISPLQLPLSLTPPYSNKDNRIYCGLAGVFDDSLPDSYGMAIMDRYFESKGISVSSLSLLHRLMFIGDRGMGALEYLPKEHDEKIETSNIVSTKNVYENMKDIIAGKNDKSIEDLLSLIDSASPIGGGRPKMLVNYNEQTKKIMFHSKELQSGYSRYILKFDEFFDDGKSKDKTKFEYLYMSLAQKCSINIAKIELLKEGEGTHLLVKRFDRTKEDEKIHMCTASALTHKHISIPKIMSYEELIRLTYGITGKYAEVVQLYRRIVFNIFSLNNDAHVKNFSFLMDKEGKWSLSPAYDITYTRGPGSLRQAMSIKGKDEGFTKEDLLSLAKLAAISEKEALEVINNVIEVLKGFEADAAKIGISKNNIDGAWFYIKERIVSIEGDF